MAPAAERAAVSLFIANTHFKNESRCLESTRRHRKAPFASIRPPVYDALQPKRTRTCESYSCRVCGSDEEEEKEQRKAFSRRRWARGLRELCVELKTLPRERRSLHPERPKPRIYDFSERRRPPYIYNTRTAGAEEREKLSSITERTVHRKSNASAV
ncbi:hypothetical protein MRX96_036331 [Rhipicephalus microplus]